MTATVDELVAALPTLLLDRDRAAELFSGTPEILDDLVAVGRLAEVLLPGMPVRYRASDLFDLVALA
jgi:hypothetical protein